VRKVPKKEAEETAMHFLQRVRIPEQANKYPGQLSGGQQQRVAIARALVTNPAILMADEPTGNLDTATGESILALFEALHAQGLTLIMVTHDDRIAGRCERVVRLRDGAIESDRAGGRVQASGSPA
jgi:putative ABC transport system ATP-binding protein